MYQTIDKDKIIQFIKTKGPVIPKDLVKSFGSDTFMMGATLSELVANGKLLITTVKIGGSPFYYLPEQKARLQELNKHLNEKDIKAYNLLKEKKVLKDNELTPLLRVSLRYIPDYARPLQVTVDNTTELFWGWYLLAQEECVAFIQQHLMLKQPQDELQKEIKPDLKAEPLIIQKTILKEYPLTEINQSEKETIKAITDEEKDKGEKDTEKIKKKQSALGISGTSESFIQDNIKEVKEQQSLQSLTKPQTNIKHDSIKDELFLKLKLYFNENNITFGDVEIIKKNKEIDCMAEVPSPVGKIEYLCKIKTKKKCNEGDLASAYVKGQKKNLPVLFITTGEVTKKAQSILTTEFRNMKIVFLN